jgi:toxin ParE1/3/4
MDYSISIASAAENDIREAFLWYEKKASNLGKMFSDDVSSAIESIQRNPLKTQIRYSNTRVFFLQTFPYGIHFQVDNTANRILILAVLHTSQDPKQWRQN